MIDDWKPYIVVQENSREQLEEGVKNQIRNQYVPIGGVFIIDKPLPYEPRYCQAMVSKGIRYAGN